MTPAHEDRGAFAPRQRLHLSIPSAFDTGIRPAVVTVRANHDLGAIEVYVPDLGETLLFDPLAAIELALQVVAANARLRNLSLADLLGGEDDGS